MNSEHDLSAAEQQLPPIFLERLQLILPQQCYRETLASFADPGRCTFRVNTLKTTVAECIGELRLLGLNLLPGEFIDEAYSVPWEQRETLVYCAAHERGDIYIQNYSSMVPPVLLQLAPGQEVTMQHPGFPVTLAYPSAICVAPCSWRARTSFMSSA